MPDRETITEPTSDAVPTAVVRRRRFSIMWILPVLGLAVVGWIVWNQAMRERGPMITITFADAGGLEPGSEIVHRGVTVGVVRDVGLTDDLQAVEIEAELRPDATGLAVEGTRFWVVRAEVSLQRIAGLDTLIGPRYIALDPAPPGSGFIDSFIALDAPPRTAPPEDDSLRLVLMAQRLGNLAPGSPVLYREIRVGSVVDAVLSNDATRVLVTIDIQPRYAPLVHANTRFWRTGGVGVDFGIFSGLSVEADSLDALLNASVSLATPEKNRGQRVHNHARFDLADTPEKDWLQWEPAIDLEQP